MFRKLWPIVLCVVMLVGACTPTPAAVPTATSAPGNTPAPANSPVPTAGGSGKISFMVPADPEELKAYNDLVAAFKQKNAAIEVEVIAQPDEEAYIRRLTADLLAGTPADVTLLDYELLGQFFGKNAFTPVAPYLAKSQVIHEADFYPQALAPFHWQGDLMCIPLNISNDVVFYNKNLFEAAGVALPKDGWTWDDFLAAAQATTKADQDQYGLGADAELGHLAPFIWQNGGEMVDDLDKPTRLALDSPAAKEALEFVFDLQLKHHVVPDEEEIHAQGDRSRFQNGTTAMLIASRRRVVDFRTITAFDWDVAPLPKGKQQASVLHSDGYCITAASKNPDAAWAFVEFANSPEGQTLLAKTGRTVPSLKTIAESPVYLDPSAKPAHSQVWIDQIPFLHSLPVVSAWDEVEEKGGEELERAFYGETSLDKAIEEAIDQTKEVFEESSAP